MAANGILHAEHHAAPADLRSWLSIRFSPCEHGPGDLIRLRRPQWLRVLVPRRRLYQCPHCGVRVMYAR